MILSKSQAFTSSGTFTVPASVSLVYMTHQAPGAGGGGGSGGFGPGGGGGAGELMIRMPYWCTPGDVIPINIGTAGTGGALNFQGTGGGTIDDGRFVTYGPTGTHYGGGWANQNGPGGGFLGGNKDEAGTEDGLPGGRESPVHFGGSGGGGGGSNVFITHPGFGSGGVRGGPGGTPSEDGNPGGGGGSSIYGMGGTGGATNNHAGTSATGKGAGGGAASGAGAPGGNGTGGYVIVEWAAA